MQINGNYRFVMSNTISIHLLFKCNVMPVLKVSEGAVHST